MALNHDKKTPTFKNKNKTSSKARMSFRTEASSFARMSTKDAIIFKLSHCDGRKHGKFTPEQLRSMIDKSGLCSKLPKTISSQCASLAKDGKICRDESSKPYKYYMDSTARVSYNVSHQTKAKTKKTNFKNKKDEKKEIEKEIKSLERKLTALRKKLAKFN